MSYGQIITKMPEIDDQSSYEVNISRVEVTAENTIVYFVYEMARPSNNAYQFRYPNQLNMGQSTISFNPKSYLNGNGKKYNYLKSVGIPETPEELNVKPGEKYRFSVYFEKLEPGIELFNLIEGKNNPNDKYQYWNFYGVKIKNPSNPQEMALDKIILLKGKLLDAATEKPIQGTIKYFWDNDTQKGDSTQTNSNGEYSFKIKPEAYTFQASAKGYESSKESIDLTQSNLKKDFNQYIYLSPIKKESVRDNLPVKLEENKFRLDKVYFDLGKANVLEESHEQLNLLADTLKKNNKIKILIEGHTDNIGDSKENKRLSYERAYNVREYLINKGIEGKRIQIKGWGDEKPISENNSEEGRKSNRRVEFMIIEK